MKAERALDRAYDRWSRRLLAVQTATDPSAYGAGVRLLGEADALVQRLTRVVYG